MVCLTHLFSVSPYPLVFTVRTFGTEGRAGSEASEVPGSDEVFEIIVFRAADISEIFMIEAPTAVNVDPAIVNVSHSLRFFNISS